MVGQRTGAKRQSRRDRNLGHLEGGSWGVIAERAITLNALSIGVIALLSFPLAQTTGLDVANV
ncbi:hypothetical protein [Leptothoe sp. PORK10 BA2]|uniref:hypothetical protein n=1 Tax=Leptothoe sp. PORK10 BA2 TaxID=3110254 RepID=UPI002B1EDFA5|nr:hypothetical protein [Leptothoe sp. PORK10 BA2]MEA5464802.1 hypothetical protein [Leptothoe sp. PORK10 BA2]